MLTKNIKQIGIALTCVFSFGVSAGTTTWEWDLRPGSTGNTVTSCSGSCPKDSFSVTDTQGSDSVKADLSAWSDTQGSSGAAPDKDPVIDQAQMYFWGDNNGWGAVNSDENSGDNPGHAFDNQGNTDYIDYDMALVSFDTSVALKGIDFGWVSDGDFTLLAYTGAGSFSGSNLNGSTWATQASSGNWLTVGQYNGGVTDSYYAVNSGSTSSKYWLIGAYNSVFGPVTNSHIDANDDAFKIKKLTGTTTEPDTQVPTPATLGLMLLGAIGVVARRRKQKVL